MAKISHISLYDLELVCDFYNRLKGTIFLQSLSYQGGGACVAGSWSLEKRSRSKSREPLSLSEKQQPSLSTGNKRVLWTKQDVPGRKQTRTPQLTMKGNIPSQTVI